MPNGRELTPEEQYLLAEKKQQVKAHAAQVKAHAAAVVVGPWDQLASHICALETAIAELKALAGIE